MDIVSRRESMCKGAIGRVFIEQLEIVCEEQGQVAKWTHILKITCAEEGKRDMKQKYIDVDTDISYKRGIEP